MPPTQRTRSGDGVSAVFPFLFALADGPVVTLAAYFDESEQTGRGAPISVAGYLFKPKGYRHFVRKWAHVLTAGPKPTDSFHMTALHAADYQYKGWSVQQRAEVLRLAVDAVRKHTYGGISVLFSQSEFEREAPSDWAAHFGSMYTVACTMALRVTQTWLDDRGSDGTVAYFFERGHRFWNEADAILTAALGQPHAKELYRSNSHTYVDKKDAYGLQAADMLAWIMTKSAVGFSRNRTMDAFGPIILNLMQGQDSKYRVFRPQAEGMRMFFDSNEERNIVQLRGNIKQPRNRRLR